MKQAIESVNVVHPNFKSKFKTMTNLKIISMELVIYSTFSPLLGGDFMHHMICNFVRDMTNKTYLMLDDLGLIDIESMYTSQMKRVQKKMGAIAESVPYASGAVKRPATDVVETDDAVIITAEIPGVNKDDIDIAVTGDELSIRAKRSEEPEEADVSVHKSERSYDVFKRLIRLPAEVKAEEAKATICNGVLKITLPKVTVISKTKIGIEEICT